MKINSQTIKQMIAEELDSVMSEFKMPDTIPTPEMLGFKKVKIDPSMVSQAKEILNSVDMKGLGDFLKKNFPMDKLKLKEAVEKNIPRGKRSAGEIITENVEIMRADRMWQNNFNENIQELIQISKEDPSQRELITEWIKIFVFEKSKTWLDKNMPTIKSFTKKSYGALKGFLEAVIFPESTAMQLIISMVFFLGPLYLGYQSLFLYDAVFDGVSKGLVMVVLYAAIAAGGFLAANYTKALDRKTISR